MSVHQILELATKIVIEKAVVQILAIKTQEIQKREILQMDMT